MKKQNSEEVNVELNFYDKKEEHKNASVATSDSLFTGTMGTGQNFSFKQRFLNEVYKGNKVRVLDVNGELTELVKQLGGRTIPLDDALINGGIDDELIVSFSLGNFKTLLSEDYKPQVFTLPKKP